MVKSSVAFSLGTIDQPWSLCVLPCIWKAMYGNITMSYFVSLQNWSMDCRLMSGSLSAASGIFVEKVPVYVLFYLNKAGTFTKAAPCKQFSFKFMSVGTHYLSHTDLPDFCWIDVWACSWVTIVLKETKIVSQNHNKKRKLLLSM